MNWDIDVSNEKETQFVDDKIVAFNRSHAPFTQDNDFVSLNFHIKNENGLVIAGINSLMYCWGMLYVDVLFVEENHRGGQLGSLLLNKVEAEAKAIGASLSHLDTFDWQAKEFYLKHGYKVFGVLDDCPKGHKRYYMKKVLNYKKYDQAASLKILVDHNPSQADNDAVREGLVTDYERKMNTTRDKEFSARLIHLIYKIL